MTAYASQYSLGGSSPPAFNPELAVYKNKKKIPCKSTCSVCSKWKKTIELRKDRESPKRVVPFFIRIPPKDGRIPTPLSFGDTLSEAKNPKGSFFGGTFVKNFRRVHFWAAPLI